MQSKREDLEKSNKKNGLNGNKKPAGAAQRQNKHEKRLIDLCRAPLDSALGTLKTALYGLTSEDAEERLDYYGPNELAHEKELSFWGDMLLRFKNPLVIQLLVIALISAAIREYEPAVIVSIMIILSVGLSYILDRRSSQAVNNLGKRVQSRTYVIRDKKECEVRISEVVPGDIIALHSGSIVPADLRLISAKDFFVSESAMTGESMPVEKSATPPKKEVFSALDLNNACFFGTSVTSGTARGLVINTGTTSMFGAISERLAERADETEFDRGVRSFTWLMIRFMLVMVAIVFLVVGLTKGNWIEALLFSLAIAVGLTPEMLPMIVTVNLAKGALTMASKKVIVKRLPSIQNFGAIDILCTDKTGTLTQDKVVLEQHVDILGHASEEVLNYAYLNSHFQTGLRNLIDRAVLEYTDLDTRQCRLVDELPFDFQRRRMSVVVAYEGDHVLICKGAVEEIYACCTRYQIDYEVYPLVDMIRGDLLEEVERLNRDGFRVLGIAYREFSRDRNVFNVEDESELVLLGYIAFFDPPKADASEAIQLLKGAGVSVKVLTGDNGLVTEKVCRDVGLKVEQMVTGTELAAMPHDQYIETILNANVLVKLSPTQKEEIVNALRKRGHVIGFLGDGINDAPALKAADVGISVDSAVDVAKEAADIVLLEKSLLALEEGIMEGRRVFANIVKYIRMGASSNFGNMFSVVGASYLLPFLPMQPIQILANNLLYDISQTGIPTDKVDDELIAKPLKWNIDNIKRFMLFIGPISSIFDYATFALMWWFFSCRAFNPDNPDDHYIKLFQTGWFVISLLTQTLIVHIIRTRKVPFFGSRASAHLTMTTLIIMAIGAWLPYSPFATRLGLVALPLSYWFWAALFLVSYATLTHVVKTWFFNRYGGD